MGRSFKWAAMLGGVAVVLVGIVTLLAPNSGDWRAVIGIAVPVGFVVGAATLIVEDSAARGRSGWKWLVACVLVPPLGLVAFAIVGVYDRLHGRPGIEARWGRAGRWYLLGGVILVVTAAGLAVSDLTVQSVSVSAPGASGYFSGSCSSPLSVVLGNGAYGHSSYWSSASPILNAARSTVASACSNAATDRMRMSTICLCGALLLALVGLGLNYRRTRRRTLAGLS